MSLFLNTSSLHNHYQDCCTIDVSETIERDCLSVLHKLHDQVNGLQLVQVVVQPLARLFNPASLAALAANVSTISAPSSSSTNANSSNNNISNPPNNLAFVSNNSTGPHSNVSTPSSQHLLTGNNQDLDALSTVTSSTNLIYNSHSRSQSFASAFSNNANSNTHHTNSLLSSTSTYMMSPDTAQALIARLDTDRDVNWLMEIIGYGLSMPFSLTGEQDSVKDCCTIYCEWLTAALLPYNEHNEDSKYQQLSKLVPVPIRKDPNRYARKMLSHLYNVFLPRHSSISSSKDHSDAALTAVSRQAVLCHRVLRTIESIAHNNFNLMDSQTWDHLLALLLTVNDKLLSAPTEPDDIGTQLHDRILGVLFELMLLASAKSIPTPNLWKTFHEMSLNWRHRPALVDHWRRITLTLTKRIVNMPNQAQKLASINKQHDNEFSTPLDNLASATPPVSNALETAIANMSYENLSQTWYRFLNLIGNPVDLTDPNIISKTEEFYRSACASDNVLDPRQHPCLNVLPQIFMNSMVGLKDIIEAFLGYYQVPTEDRLNEGMTLEKSSHNRSARGSIISLTSSNPASQVNSNNQSTQQTQALTPTQSRKSGIKSMATKTGKVIPFATSVAHNNPDIELAHQTGEHRRSGSVSNQARQYQQPKLSLTSMSSRTSQGQGPQPQFKLSTERPKCNSVLHIFGDWLFSAALIGSDLNQELDEHTGGDTSESTNSVGSSSTTTEVSGSRSFSPNFSRLRLTQQRSTVSAKDKQTSQYLKQESNATDSKITLDPPLSADSFESGQAEAMAILCKIFSSRTSSEDITPTYLSRFYLCLQHCLIFGSGQDLKQIGTIKRQLLASVLINSTTLLQKDLDGINLLIPSFIKAIEFVFECSEKEVPIQPPPRQHNRSIRYGNAYSLSSITNYDLRRACILTLLNLLAYPFHFQDLAIRNCLNESSPTTTFKSLRPRLLKLLFVALQTETDPTNMQILFGGLSLTIHDLALNAGKSSKESTKSQHKFDSTSSNSTGNGSSHNSLNLGDHQDDTSSQSSFVFNSNGGFLVKSLHVTCHLLINIWKHDTQVSLAALELLTTVARVSSSAGLVENDSQQSDKPSSRYNNNNIRFEMKNEYRQTTKWICDYICNQCSRPPPAHSRDMHSSIVAAYQCLSVWFYTHSYLLNDESCVTTLMEVIELGVSGQKSRSTNIGAVEATTNLAIPKGDKMMKPSSMRVREAAESLLNICLIRSREPLESTYGCLSSYDTVLDEQSIAELYCGLHNRSNLRQIQDEELRQLEAHKMFKYFSDEDSIIFGLLDGSNQDSTTKDSVICLLRTPFGKNCWRIRFNYYTEKSREKIIANKTLGLIKRPFQQSTTPTSDTRIFLFPGGPNKSIYFNSTAKFFPSTIENLPPNDLDKLVTTLEDYISSSCNSRLRSDLDKISKIFTHQIAAEQKVMSENQIRVKRIDCEEPQPLSDLEAARMIVTQLGLKSSLNSLTKGDRISTSFVSDLKALDHQSVRTCDTVSIFYVRKNRTTPKEILESVRARHSVSLAFFEWLLELGYPTVVKNHCRWTGRLHNSWNTHSFMNSNQTSDSATLTKNQMITSDHGGAIFDGERMTLYWNDMCQELAFLIPHKIEKLNLNAAQTIDQNKGTYSHVDTEGLSSSNHSASSPSLEAQAHGRIKTVQDSVSSQMSQDQNSDVQSLCSVTSDTSSHSTRAASQMSSPREASSSTKDQRDNISLSRQSITMQKRKSNHPATIVGCDTDIIICWLECSDDLLEVPTETLLLISETGYLLDDENQHETNDRSLKLRDYAKYFISPMKNGLYRLNLITSFGRQWLALPLVDGMTVSKGVLGSLIRESVLNLCRRRRLAADSYQPPHVRRRLKLQEICNSYKISSRYDSTDFYHTLFKNKVA